MKEMLFFVQAQMAMLACVWLCVSSASMDQKLQKTPKEHTQQTNFRTNIFRKTHADQNKFYACCMF